jgi:succinate-acetate transporter protein
MTPPPVVAASKEGIANPAPLGLCAFGTTTVLLNLHNAGFFEMNSMILAMGIFYGGLAQVIAGIIEAKKNNTFGLTAFTSYGFFWLSLVALIVMPKMGWIPARRNSAMAAYLAIWGLFTLLLFFGTLKLKPCAAVCVCDIDYSVFPIGARRCHREWQHQTSRRL